MRQSNALLGLLAISLAGCVTSRIEDDRSIGTGLEEGESIVVMAKSYHQGNETEADYIACVEKALGKVFPRGCRLKPCTAIMSGAGTSLLMPRHGEEPCGC